MLRAVNHLVANAGIWSSCSFDEVTNITAFTKMMVKQIHKSFQICFFYMSECFSTIKFKSIIFYLTIMFIQTYMYVDIIYH